MYVYREKIGYVFQRPKSERNRKPPKQRNMVPEGIRGDDSQMPQV
jgi:hypothetical protein